GEVVFPGVYTLQTPGETLARVIERAGGLTPFAYPDGAKLFRSFEGAGLVGIDLESAINRPNSRANMVMMPGDSLAIPEMNNTVRVAGAVGYPNSVLHVPGKSLRYYIDMAGGYSENANKKRTTVVLANGAAWHPNWFIIPDPPIGPGANIFVPVRPEETRDIWETIRDTTALLTSFTTVLLLIWQIGR
ncbi:SLBB domain-containing protein, partial [bacterium]|nr:SLBB domain-containing protein [bacterium]